MSLSLGTLVSPPDRYNFDDSHPGIIPQMYLNDQSDDCVIAARAHHTVRLAYVAGAQILNISNDEIFTEYTAEATSFHLGIVLSDSLQLWKDPGWTAGMTLRHIDDAFGPFSLNAAGMLAGDATRDLTIAQMKGLIIDHTGVQADLNLPDGIDVNDKTTFGANTLWKDTTPPGSATNRHVMLLNGYDEQGPIGITWAAVQHMTWAFLRKYHTGIYWVQKGPST
jgi:hypothetical protein